VKASKESLIDSARRLKAPDAAAVEVFTNKRVGLVYQVIQEMSVRPDFDRLVGAGNRQMAADNGQNFARFMESLFSEFEPEVLVETALWVFRAYLAHGFQRTYWPAHLETWVRILRRELPEAVFEQVYPFYHWFITHIPIFTALAETEAAQKDP